MNCLKILLVLLIVPLPTYAEVEVIEWGSNYNKGYIVDDSKAKVDIYVTSWCPYCKKAIAYLNAKGIKYNKYDIEKDMGAAARKRALAPNYLGIPLAVIHGQTIKGFSKKRYSSALDNR